MTLYDIEEYRKAAFERSKNKVDLRILNDSLAHANILIDSMIGTASEDETVGIYTGCFPEQSFRPAITKTQAKEILVVVDDDSELDWLKKLDKHLQNRIHVFKISKPRPNHFFYTSGGAFRFELDSSNYKAEANFNEADVVSKLKSALRSYLKDSKPHSFNK